jgi:uncharacterized membrane protein
MIPGLYSLFLKRLCEIKTNKKIIPFPLVIHKICSNFSITKGECLEILLILKDFGFIEIHSGHGIKILKKEMSRKDRIKLLARDVPLSCINKCDKCHEDFEAKITVQDTCDKCRKKWSDDINKKVKGEIAKGNTNPEWVLILQELMEEKEN